MLNKIAGFIRSYGLLHRGDHVTCGVSGGADSMALLWSMILLREKLGITVSAAHFNHHLRGAESDRDEAFVREFCAFHDIPLVCGGGEIEAGEKGLEAAARDARYAFFAGLPGKIATAHTADDNAETVLMHLLRGSGLRGLGGISPVRGSVIRPMLTVTREEVEAFLRENFISHIEDSSNGTDAFLRNRLRHSVVPLLKAENPKLAQNLTAMALRLRADSEYLDNLPQIREDSVSALRDMPAAVRGRALERYLKENGVKEPESQHISMVERLVFSPKPSASVQLPGGITIARSYDVLKRVETTGKPFAFPLEIGSSVVIPEANVRISCREASDFCWEYDRITVCPEGSLIVRSRQAGDSICLSGGTKSLKKLMIDRKIPADQRNRIPVVADDRGVVAVMGIGGDQNRKADHLPAVEILFESLPEASIKK